MKQKTLVDMAIDRECYVDQLETEYPHGECNYWKTDFLALPCIAKGILEIHVMEEFVFGIYTFIWLLY